MSESSSSDRPREKSVDEILDNKTPKKLNFFERYIYRVPVYFILAIEFVERFGYYALTAILIIFFTSQLGLSNKNAVMVYHAMSMLGYFTPLIGAIVSDDYIGRYKTILSFGIIYFIGTVILAITSIPAVLEKVTMAGPFIGLFFIMLGMGGIKPCVSTFGADQFSDQESHKMETYFSVFYMSINVGSILSYLISPILRSKVKCFGGDCYFLAFGLPAILMFLVLVIFISGTRLYSYKKNESNAIGKIARVTYIAIRERLRNIRKKSNQNLLDWAKDHVDSQSISDAKILYKIILIFIPIPMFWALFNQQGSLWTIQAIRMSGYMGSAGYMVPDQMQVVNPILIIILLPLVDAIIASLVKLKVKVKPLRKIFAGMVISGFAFLISGGLDIVIDKEIGGSTHIKENFAGIQFYNELPNSVMISTLPSLLPSDLIFAKNEISNLQEFPAQTSFQLNVRNSLTPNEPYLNILISEEDLISGHQYSLVLFELSGAATFVLKEHEFEVDSSGAHIRFILLPGTEYSDLNTSIITVNQNVLEATFGEPTDFVTIPFGSDDGKINGHIPIPLNYNPGGIYTLVITMNDQNNVDIKSYENRSPSKYHMLLQIPQYLIITIGEILISVTGLSFAYDQAPKRIKVAITGAWLLTTAFGNLIVIIVEAIAGESKGSVLFFVFAGLMFVVSILFAVIAYYYKPNVNIVARYSANVPQSVDEPQEN